MGVYSQYTASVGESSIGHADERYSGVVGAYMAMEESAINTHTVFESIISRDWAEAYCEAGILDESTMDYVNESAIGDAFKKVLAFLGKIKDKILGVLKSIKDRIVGVCTRDGKELYNKFKKQVATKSANGDFGDKFKFKYKERGSKYADLQIASGLAAAIENTEAHKRYHDDMGEADVSTAYEGDAKRHAKGQESDGSNKAISDKDKMGYGAKYFEKKHDDNPSIGRNKSAIRGVNDMSDSNTSANQIKPYSSDELTDIKEESLASIIKASGSVSEKDFFEEYHDGYFESEEVMDNFSKYEDEIIEVLVNSSGSNNRVRELEKAEKTTNDKIKAWQKDAEAIQKKFSKLAGKDENTVNAAKANRLASRAISMCNIMSKCVTLTVSAWTNCYKEEFKQARAVWIKAATWSPKSEATLIEGMVEVSDNEVEAMFDFV